MKKISDLIEEALKSSQNKKRRKIVNKIVKGFLKSKPPKIPKKIKRLRRRAREEGIIADKLKHLKDKNGNPVRKGKFYYCFNINSNHGCGYVKGSPLIGWPCNNPDLVGLFVVEIHYCRVCGQEIRRIKALSFLITC